MKPIADILTPARIAPIRSTSKDDVLAEVCALLDGAPEITNREALIKAIRAREAIMSTGIGMGIAIPHAKIASVTDIVMAVGWSVEGVPFQALDNLPVHLVILTAASDTQGTEFLRLLSSLGTLFYEKGNLDQFLAARSSEDIHRLFRDLAI